MESRSKAMRKGQSVQSINASMGPAPTDIQTISALPRGFPALVQCLRLYVAAHPEKFRHEIRQEGQRRICLITVPVKGKK